MAMAPVALSLQATPPVVEPEAMESERDGSLPAAVENNNDDELGPLSVPLSKQRLSSPGSASAVGSRSPGSMASKSTACTPASKTSVFSLGRDETSPSQRLRGPRKGAVIVNVVGEGTAPVKIQASEFQDLEEDGMLKWDKVQEVFASHTGERVTSLYYRIRCSIHVSTEAEQDANETMMRLVLFEDGPNPFLGGMLVYAYLNGETPLETAHSAGKGGVACCAVQ